MKNQILKKFFIVGLIALAVSTVVAADESELIAILKSNASIPQKCDACRQLRVVGTVKSVDALAALLGTERVGHAARYALEAMPYAEAGKALGDAMKKTSGTIKAGLIDSLGWRRDTAAVPLLIPLLKDSDSNIAVATASALGRIGNGDAVAALKAARRRGKPEVKKAVNEALLRCAESLLKAGKDSDAAKLYRDLMKSDVSSSIRIAAWRGLALSDGNRRTELVIDALTGSDEKLRIVAIKLVRQTDDDKLIRSCLRQWETLGEDAQVLLINVLASRGDSSEIADILKAHKSSKKAVRIAAINAVGVLGDASSVAFLAERAAGTSGDEQTAARQSLKVLGGENINIEMIKQIKDADSNVQIELIQSLADRRATVAASLLLRMAKIGDRSVRLASYKSLRDIAAAQHLKEMVAIVEQAAANEKSQVEKAIVAVAQRSKAQQQASEIIAARLDSVDNAARISLVSILGQLGDSKALPALREALNSKDTKVRYVAIQALSNWPTGEPKDQLLRVARTADSNTHKVLALRGYIDLIGRDISSVDEKIEMYNTAMDLANGTAEKKRVLGGVAGLHSLQALKMAQPYLKDNNLKAEAAVAVTTICQAIYKENKKQARAALMQVVSAKVPDFVTTQAKKIIKEIESIRDYLTDWEVCGPYVQKGKGYAQLFDIPFGPEVAGEKVDWKPMPISKLNEHPAYLDLLKELNGGLQRVAYLRTKIESDENASSSLEIFCDDGAKVWLNGKVVHTDNTAHAIPATPDTVKVMLKKGTNTLMLKVTQNNMPWGAIVRIRMPKPVITQVGKGFKVHVINAESKFEAAGVCDVNNDGKLDIFSGGFWYEAPNWKKHFVREVKYDGNYYYDFASLPMDIDGDGWVDIASAAWHNKMVYWVRNPGDSGGKWQVIEIDTPGNMETALSFDINSDGQPDVLPNIMSDAAWYEFHSDPSEKNKVRWEKHQLPKEAAGHGNGAGDINGDGRCDIVAPRGWVEQPAEKGGEWKWHGEFDLGHCSVPALVHDVDGDKDADIIWGFGHNYGLFWLEQGKDAAGKRTWTKHEIDSTWSQPHFMLLADLNNDGADELVTGKRYHAHNGNDPGGNDPKCVYYYTFDRSQSEWRRHVIHEGGEVALGINTQAVDMDKDGDIDIVAPGKSGLYLIENLLK